MSDIFREVEEDVRRERLEKFWKAYGDYVIAAGILLLAAIGGFELWQHHQADQRAKAATALIAAQRISNPTQAADALDTVAKSAPGGYALVARLGEANAMAASGQTKNAIDLYKQIADQDDGAIGAVARLRAAWAQADTATRGDLTTLLAPIDKPGSAWHSLAREVLAYADYRALDLKAAQTKYQLLMLDPQAPEGVRARARAMVQFIKQGGAGNSGTVPPPVASAAPTGQPTFAPAAPTK
ncbi:MAG TPA: tetratricopeptide repeat protein [Rhizomicrobium sp.]|nr:tetratricopeptide repeat protein [Rhizomicrobium sp.]